MACNAISIKTEGDQFSATEWSKEVDHMPLARRRKLSLSSRPSPPAPRPRPPPGFGSAVVKSEDKELDSQSSQNGAGRQCCNSPVTNLNSNAIELKKPVEVKGEYFDNLDGSLVDKTGASASSAVLSLEHQGNVSNDFDEDLDHVVLKKRLKMLLSRKTPRLKKPTLGGITAEFNSDNNLNSAFATTRNFSSSTSLNVGKIKDEPLDNCELQNQCCNVVDNSYNIASVKNETEISDQVYEDQVDHVQLQDQMELQATGRNSELLISRVSRHQKNFFPTTVEYGATKETPNPIKIIRPRKRKKSATNSVETALEEDAPGLLKSLIEQGVDLDEIKLFGEPDADEPIDESFIEDSFGELEAVISKIFFKRCSLLKLAPVRPSKGSKPSYCLACLLALVEQTRYLRFRNWPAEWGWCRDLQSFIFVFERHNRIVVERPEYGYATYFFELVDSSSIEWQVKRLVTAMKLTNCGRINLIENKALVVGEDLGEGEAKVLMHYGWTPNTGLGTMLNYCDRVYHDRKFEKETSEWRLKIGNLLKDGFNRGTNVSSIKEMDTGGCNNLGNAESEKIKMEL